MVRTTAITSVRRVAVPIVVAAMCAAGCGASGGSDDGETVSSETTETPTSAAAGSEDGAPEERAGEAGAPEERAGEAGAPEERAGEAGAPEESAGEDGAATDGGESDDATSDDAAAPGGTGDGDCLVGNWVISQDALNGYYDGLEDSLAGAPVDFQIEGTTTLDFNPDGTFQYLPTFTLTMDTGGIVGDGTTSGSVRGTYAIDAEAGIVVADITEDDLDVVVTVSGVTISSAEMGTDLATAPINEAPYDCSGDTPVLLFEVADGARVPVPLTPA